MISHLPRAIFSTLLLSVALAPAAPLGEATGIRSRPSLDAPVIAQAKAGDDPDRKSTRLNSSHT